MNKLLFISFLFYTLSISAQYRYTVTSIPDSAVVKLNGNTKCYTPCRMSFYWGESENGQITISVEKDGFQSWSDTYQEKMMNWDYRERVLLEPNFPNLELDDTPLISFDKLLVDFPNGKEIGNKVNKEGAQEKIKWDGSIKVGDENFAQKFFEIATNMGFNTAVSEGAKLFSEENDRPQLPRYVVGVEISDFKLNYVFKEGKDYGDGDYKGTSWMQFSWKVLDKKNGKIVHQYENEKDFSFRQESYQSLEYHSSVFELALIDFFKSDGFIKLLKESNDDAPLQSNESVEEISEKIIVEKVEISVPKSQSDVIKIANPSCVTIITDGGHGSGVVIDSKGLVLSAYHVVEGVNKIDVKFSSGLTLQAEIFTFDKSKDLVLLDINGEGFSALPIAWDKNDLELGEEVITIGTPAELELGQSVSKGIVSGKRKYEESIYTQLDMAVSPGNSGGPLLNNKGEVVGIVQRKLIGTGIEGIGFAIPMPIVIETLNLEEAR